MARLRSHGRELLRISSETSDTRSDVTNWDRCTWSVRSDRHIMRKLDVRFTPSKWDKEPEGRKHSYGWKLWKRVKKGVDLEGFAAKKYLRAVANPEIEVHSVDPSVKQRAAEIARALEQVA